MDVATRRPIPGSIYDRKKLRNQLSWAIGLVLAVGVTWAVTRPLRSHVCWMYFEQDDFFYYLKVARNLAAGHGSTFNGLVPTNGYHPLWMLLLAAVFRAGASDHGIFIFLAVSIWLATIATYLLTRALFSASGLEALTSSISAAFVAAYSLHLYVECMEVTLAVPLMFAVLLAVQSVDWWAAGGARGYWRGAAIGLLASAMILARLDTAIFAALLAVGLCAQASLRRVIRVPQLAGAATGLLPIAAYLLTNHIIFHTWMPVSGMAKQLKLDHGFTGKALTSVMEFSKSQWLNVAGIVIVLFALPWLWRKLRPVEKAFGPAALIFPFLYFAIVSWSSDWRIWGWYFYALRPALCVAMLLLFRSATVQRLAGLKPLLALFGLITCYRIATLEWDVQVPTLADAAIELQAFAATHPGVYAMGDRAGIAGYLLPQPMVQSEGLMMDRAFLSNIVQQRPLLEALAPFHVRYYVGSAMQPYTGCFQAVEPWQAGPHAPHMRAVLCRQPLARWMHEGVETLVFDLDQHP